ncbi:hypothetical protein LNI96_11970 [Tenacibaculum dicentrarchi]|nr:hypothetical protein [Tenacibaculum dicentrarchi]
MNSDHLDLEERIHKWIENDISIILPNAILIGSKIKTDHGKEIDLLAIDENGDLIIIELKRGLTPREVTAQALDYASWVNTLKEEDVNDLLNKRGINKSVSELLSEKFDNNEDVDINENQKIYIVASSIDTITERICKYLASNGLQINVLTFDYFNDEGREYVARNFLVTESYSPKDNVKKRNGRYITKLFQEDKLKVNQQVKYIPLEEKGITKTATIFRVGSKCLKLDGTDETYSFSGLRKKLILDNALDLNPHFPYWQWTEWAIVENDLKLSDM